MEEKEPFRLDLKDLATIGGIALFMTGLALIKPVAIFLAAGALLFWAGTR